MRLLSPALVACLTLAVPLGPASAQPAARNVTFMANMNEYAGMGLANQNYSACWSYVHTDGSEYAVIGVYSGTAIYNVTNPSAPYRVAFIAGPPSIWREMKSYQTWIYLVTEGGGAGEGVQIVRMTNPESPILVGTYATNFVRSHTVSVDPARALLICNGTRNSAGEQTGVRILSLANPEAPAELATWPAGVPPPVPVDLYVHDSVPVGNRLYASSINSGRQRVLDFTNPSAPFEIASWVTPGAYTHNAWPDATGNYLYVTDEVPGKKLAVYDISNL
ncbi:MAG TPA: hypothetical protein VEY91_06690, partial [Candidatus Limnocylindria bacterium]|nr:hypothetical protein [Candidatus Limnocylindria bacterium]